MPTIQDVAKKAAVSVTTVSNVINNKGSVSDETYDRVMGVIKELNYRPSIIAKNLKKRNTRFIAVIMPNFEHHYASIFRGIQSVLDDANYLIIPKTTNGDPIIESQIITELIDMDVCGYLMVPSSYDHSLYKEIVTRKIPIIFLERKVEGVQFSSVVFDNRSSIEKMTLQCFEKYGRDQVMLVIGDPNYSSEVDCVQGYMNACNIFDKAHGETHINENLNVISGQTNTDATFFSLFDKIIKLESIPKCFIVSNTQIACTMREILHLMQSDSMVFTLGADEWRESNIVRNNLVKIPREALQMGITGANLLLEYIKNFILFENATHTVVSRDYIKAPINVGILSQPKKKLRVLALDSPASKALEMMSVAYKEKFGYEVEVDICKYKKIHASILEQSNGEKLKHDIVMIDIPWINHFKENGFLYDMTDFVQPYKKELLGDYPSVIKKSFYQDGLKISGIPIMATIQLLYYRKDLFESVEMQRDFERMYGFGLYPPRTWTEFNIVAKFFTREINEKSPVEVGTLVCGANATGLVDEFLPRMWSFGGEMINEDGESCINSVENVRAIKNLKETYKLAPEEYQRGWWDEEIKMLMSGKCAMVHGFSSLYPVPSQAKAYGDYYNKIGVMSIPGGKPVLGGWMLGINAKCEAPREAFEFIRWVLGEGYRTHNALLGWMIPVKSVYTNTMLKLERQWLRLVWEGFSVSNKRKDIRDRNGRIIDPYWLDMELAKCIKDVIEDRKTNEEALRRMDEILRG